MNAVAAKHCPAGRPLARWIASLGFALVCAAVVRSAPCRAPSGTQSSGTQSSGDQSSGSQTPSAPQSTGQPTSGGQSSAAPYSSTQNPPSLVNPPQSGAAHNASASTSPTSAPEMNTRSSQVPLESHVNLVPIRVIVHDGSEHAVENLRKEDFQVRQDGRVQFITHFSVETSAAAGQQVARGESIPVPPDPSSYSISGLAVDGAGDAGGTAPSDAAAGVAGTSGKLVLPTRFVALLFDDSHLDVGDLTRAKVAALKFIETSVGPRERLALLTISGRSQVDFTNDLAKIRDTLKTMIPNPVGAYDPATQHDCLQITYYQADLIQNKNDQQASAAANADALACTEGNATQAAALVASTVPIVLQAGEINTQYAVRRLQEVVQRVAALPGQRSIVLVSPGFLTPTYEYEVSEIIDKANHSNVFINTLDARGLYTVDPIGDIRQDTPVRASAATAALSLQYRLDEQRVQCEVLADLAYSTGGFYFRNNNDLGAGFRVTAAEPEVSYLLAIVPEGLKNDGKFHSLNVKLLTKEKYTVQARRGFFAPKRGETPEQLAKQDIEDALFSQEEQQGLPVQLHLQYYKVDEMNAKLLVLAHVDLSKVRFEKSAGRNWDDLTVVTGLFDRNGNFISGQEKTLEMRLKDATLEKLNQTGVTLKTNFDVKPGGYLVRLVVRDMKAAQLSARNGVVEIP
ncbi:MAG: VWA domain-containing protein, partial [Candidatus Acidiferrales bacterium]